MVMILLIKNFCCKDTENELQSYHNKTDMDAGFLNVVEVGQYFMTKDTGDLTQFNTVACREYTLPREDGSSQPRGWIQGNKNWTRVGSYDQLLAW